MVTLMFFENYTYIIEAELVFILIYIINILCRIEKTN